MRTATVSIVNNDTNENPFDFVIQGTGSAADTTPPTATIVVTDTALRAGETSPVTITFSEAVTGLELLDLTAENGVLTGLSSADGGVTWTATLTPFGNVQDATNVITLNNSGVADLAGNPGTGTTTSNNYAIDTVAPDRDYSGRRHSFEGWRDLTGDLYVQRGGNRLHGR